ncbi:hypothetical protein [Bifidobacterium vansinderenii]|uniref:hypothetical protein n=1 Tax=Bifidobacterium vansinderenii TaxID=1984871 RepID=UPI000B8B403B|nr:hypothetical protein [Bifidobacterium vansinderenii]
MIGFTLFLTLQGCNYYGHIPEPPLEASEKVRVYPLETEDLPLLEQDFIEPVDKLCNALLDIGDVDYLNAEQCRILLTWISDRLGQPIGDRLVTIYRTLADFAHQAISLNTGIVIEL